MVCGSEQTLAHVLYCECNKLCCSKATACTKVQWREREERERERGGGGGEGLGPFNPFLRVNGTIRSREEFVSNYFVNVTSF